ncbi:MAG: class I mannose-6-phosphate isomerase [bacterium]|nr:class I mannose-6-phosphate isomerase [bacterium]
MAAFYPLTFKPIYKSKLWGGHRIAALFHRDLPAGSHIGESWELADRPDDNSVVASGPFAGMSFAELRTRFPLEMFGDFAPECQRAFPLMIKFIDAQEPLSLQVHPDNRYALKHANDLGKTEAWYIVDAMPGATVSRGFKAGVTAEKVAKALQQGKIESLVFTCSVNRHDAIFLPAGTIHSMSGGIFLAEVAQNSDVTYRVYDYGRTDSHGRPRPLHLQQAMDVLSFRDPGSPILKPVKVEPLHYRLVICDFFSLYKYDFREPVHNYSLKRCRIFVNVDGHGTIISPEGLFDDVDFGPGTTIFMPAGVKDYSLVPATHCVMLDIIPGKVVLRKRKGTATSA